MEDRNIAPDTSTKKEKISFIKSKSFFLKDFKPYLYFAFLMIELFNSETP